LGCATYTDVRTNATHDTTTDVLCALVLTTSISSYLFCKANM